MCHLPCFFGSGHVVGAVVLFNPSPCFLLLPFRQASLPDHPARRLNFTAGDLTDLQDLVAALKSQLAEKIGEVESLRDELARLREQLGALGDDKASGASRMRALEDQVGLVRAVRCRCFNFVCVCVCVCVCARARARLRRETRDWVSCYFNRIPSTHS